MDEPFIIPVQYKGIEREFEAKVQAWTYGFRLFVDVDGTEVIFERDNEGNYRAIVPPDQGSKTPDSALVQAIAGILQTL